VSYLLNAQFSGENTGPSICIQFSATFINNVQDQYSGFDAGAIVGIGLEYVYSNKMGHGERVHFSVLDSCDTDVFTFDPRNLALSVSAYFLF